MTNPITETIRERIIRLYYKPGEALSEKKLADELQVSRTPIREALIRLSQEKFVSLTPYSVARVEDVNLKNFQELIQCRLILEKGISRLAVLNINNKQISELYELKDRISLIREENVSEFVFHDEKLHGIIREAAANRFMDSYLANIQNHFIRIQYLLSHRASKESMISEIDGIILALKDKNADKLEELLINHFERFKKVIKANFNLL